MKNLGHYWKAFLGFIAPAAVFIGSSVMESSAGGTNITSGEWVTAAVAAIVTGAAVAAKANDPKVVDPVNPHQQF